MPTPDLLAVLAAAKRDLSDMHHQFQKDAVPYAVAYCSWLHGDRPTEPRKPRDLHPQMAAAVRDCVVESVQSRR